jgi:Fe-S cluster biogenesis protein NfuA
LPKNITFFKKNFMSPLIDYKYITVYAESTPNPTAMKFVASIFLVENGDCYEFSAASSSLKNSLFAKKLFEFPFVKGLFISSNFVTITKSNNIEWDKITTQLREFIQSYLREGNPVINTHSQEFESNSPIESEVIGNVGEAEHKIMAILDEYVRPAVEQDGGLISFRSFDDGVVKVVLRGSCSGCPSSQMTLKSGIENLLKQMMPEVKSVEAVEA